MTDGTRSYNAMCPRVPDPDRKREHSLIYKGNVALVLRKHTLRGVQPWNFVIQVISQEMAGLG